MEVTDAASYGILGKSKHGDGSLVQFPACQGGAAAWFPRVQG